MQHHIYAKITSRNNKLSTSMFFSPAKATFLKAIANNQLIGVPGLTKEAVTTYLPPSSTKIKGHMHRIPKNVRSTRKYESLTVHEHTDMKPDKNIAAQYKMYCFAALGTFS